MFQGSIVALVTPFKQGELDEKALYKYSARFSDAGGRGLARAL